MTSFIDDRVLATTTDLGARLAAIRRQIHANPEVGPWNPATRDVVLDELTTLDGLRIRRADHSTALVAVLDSGRPGPTVVLHAGTDALPMAERSGLDFASTSTDAAHTCGHDAHTAMLVGAARILTAGRDRLRGRVILQFQPADTSQPGEEGGDGATESGSEIRAFAVHVSPNLPTGTATSRAGTLMASTDAIEVRFTGGPNPVQVAARLAARLSERYPSGSGDPQVTIAAIRGGSGHSVVPEDATMLFTVNCLETTTRDTALTWITHEAAALARQSGTEVTEHRVVSYPCAVTDGSAVAVARAAAEAGTVGLRWIEMPAPVTAPEDFSRYLDRWPGALVLLGACPPDIADPVSAPACRTSAMRIDEAVLPLGSAFLAELAFRVSARDEPPS